MGFYQNEGEVGEAVRDFLKENPSVKREDIFICTKVWNHLHEPEEVKWSLNNSLENFGLDYIDLFLVHWPIAAEKDDKNMPKLNDMLSWCNVKPQVTQVEIHPFLPNDELVK